MADQSTDLESLSPQQLRDIIRKLQTRQAEMAAELASYRQTAAAPLRSEEMLRRLVEGGRIALQRYEPGDQEDEEKRQDPERAVGGEP